MNILFVCTGNTCRSAMAEGFVKKFIQMNNLKDFTVESCGIASSPLYKIPNVVLKIMQNEDIDISNHLPRQITKELVDRADVILVMEDIHRSYIEMYFPEVKNKTYYLKRFVGIEGPPNIADPMGEKEEFYWEVASQIKYYISLLMNKLTKKDML